MFATPVRTNGDRCHRTMVTTSMISPGCYSSAVLPWKTLHTFICNSNLHIHTRTTTHLHHHLASFLMLCILLYYTFLSFLCWTCKALSSLCLCFERLSYPFPTYEHGSPASIRECHTHPTPKNHSCFRIVFRCCPFVVTLVFLRLSRSRLLRLRPRLPATPLRPAYIDRPLYIHTYPPPSYVLRSTRSSLSTTCTVPLLAYLLTCSSRDRVFMAMVCVLENTEIDELCTLYIRQFLDRMRSVIQYTM